MTECPTQPRVSVAADQRGDEERRGDDGGLAAGAGGVERRFAAGGCLRERPGCPSGLMCMQDNTGSVPEHKDDCDHAEEHGCG
jgi:hypothetical protein